MICVKFNMHNISNIYWTDHANVHAQHANMEAQYIIMHAEHVLY